MNLRDYGLSIRGKSGGASGNRTPDQRIKSPLGNAGFAPKSCESSLSHQPQNTGKTLSFSRPLRELLATIRERSQGRCECDGVCARQHTGRCPNIDGVRGNGSRWPVRLTLVAGREICQGCREPFNPDLTRPRRTTIPPAEAAS